MSGAIPPLSNMPPWRGTQLKHRDNFMFTFTHPHTVFICLNEVSDQSCIAHISYKFQNI